MNTDDHLDRDEPRHPNAHGLPSNPELAERLARVEEKQDHVVERIDHIADSLDKDLAELEQSHNDVKEKNTRLWLIYRFGRWGLGSGAILTMVFVLFF